MGEGAAKGAAALLVKEEDVMEGARGRHRVVGGGRSFGRVCGVRFEEGCGGGDGGGGD